MRIRTILAAAAAPAALAAVLLGTAGQASAAVVSQASVISYSGRVTQTGVPDTTFGGNAGHATEASGNGPVWASDDIARNITITPAGQGLWTVSFVENGKYNAFADPNSGDYWTNTGTMHGTVSYTVASDTPPDMSKLPASLPGMVDPSNNAQVLPGTMKDLTGLTVQGHGYIIGLVFPNNKGWQGVTGGPWDYHYTQVQNTQGVYEQAG